ncbi:hypothetical protein IHN59_09990 [Deinococcus sp. 23YEL01]|nr:hypothetical protein [Deinococcus sp. 23YEL01]
MLETALPDLPPGGGARLLNYTQALIAGLQPMSDPSSAVRAALDGTDLAALHLRLDGVLSGALHALITGLTVPPDRNVQNESRRREEPLVDTELCRMVVNRNSQVRSRQEASHRTAPRWAGPRWTS